MHKAFAVLTAVSCGFWGASQAKAASICDAAAGNLVANCGFETGDFTSWTLSGNTLNPGGEYYGVDTIDANSGTYGAYMSQDFLDDGTAPVDLSQTLTTNPGDTYSISFYLEQDTTPYGGYTHMFSAAFGGTNLVTLTPTPASPGTVGSFTDYTFSETAAGASTALNFSFENDDTYWSFDDVSVTDTTTPEPSTYLLAGIALSALLLLKRA
jgi:hypothetical protein